MAVSKNPYKNWSDNQQNADYRDKTTQIFAQTRQQLSESKFLSDSNRVNPGTRRNMRADLASSKPQVPHDFSNEELWGWQKWADKKYCSSEAELAEGLVVPCSDDEIQNGGVNPSPPPAT